MDNHNNLNNIINYTHSTKEVIQQIKFIKGEIAIPSPYDILCFRTAMVENRNIVWDPSMLELFNNSKVCIVEICSMKKYIHNDFYLHNLCVHASAEPRFKIYTPSHIFSEYKCINQTEDEIENDILEIQRMIYPKKLIIVTHYNSKINGEVIPSRDKLIKLLIDIGIKHGIDVINPTEVLKTFDQNDVMYEDLCHYREIGASEFAKFMNAYVQKFL